MEKEQNLAIDMENRTYVNPENGKTLPFDYALSDEVLHQEILPLARDLIKKCTEHAVPVEIFLQTGRTEASDTLSNQGFLPGPRVGNTMGMIYQVVRLIQKPGVTPLLCQLVGRLSACVDAHESVVNTGGVKIDEN